MFYLEEVHARATFDLVERLYCRKEEIPRYSSQPNGVLKYLAALERIRDDAFYPSVYDKAANLMLQINEGHYFFNGNKRLALVSTIGLLGINGRDFRQDLSACEHEEFLRNLFPVLDDHFDRDPELEPAEFGLYNLSLFIADHISLGITIEEFKEHIPTYLENITKDRNENGKIENGIH